MRRWWWACLLVVLTACSDPTRTTPTANPAPTQTRAAELAQLATLTAPTVTSARPPQPGGGGSPAASRSPTVRPSPVVVAEGEVGAANVSSYRDGLGQIWFIGEVVNRGRREVGDIAIAITLLDDAGRVTESSPDIVLGVPILRPGEKTVWKVLMNQRPPAWTTERIAVRSGDVPPAVRATTALDLQVADVTVADAENGTGAVTVGGRVRNTGPDLARLVVVTVGLYDGEGRLFAVMQGFAQQAAIQSGTAAPFSIRVAGAIRGAPTSAIYVAGTR